VRLCAWFGGREGVSAYNIGQALCLQIQAQGCVRGGTGSEGVQYVNGLSHWQQVARWGGRARADGEGRGESAGAMEPRRGE
jgi:hypothetical protein